MSRIKNISIWFMAIAYVYIGIQHFLDSDLFVAIVPDYLPYTLELVYISGFFEVLFGLLLLFPKYRSYAAWGLILLLIAVFPANVYMVQSAEAQEVLGVSKELAIARLPFQLVFIALAYWHTKK